MTVSSAPMIFLGFGLFLLLFHTMFGGFFRILLRSGFSLLFLDLLAKVPALSCLALGVNPVNALVLGILGIPGFGLLLLLRWTLQLPS